MPWAAARAVERRAGAGIAINLASRKPPPKRASNNLKRHPVAGFYCARCLFKLARSDALFDKHRVSYDGGMSCLSADL